MGKIITSRGLSPTLPSNILAKLSLQCILIPLALLTGFNYQQLPCDQYPRSNFVTFAQAQQRFVDSSTIKPSLILILPQSFKAPINPSLGNITNSDLPKLQQYVAIVNNAQDDQEDEKIRQHYKRLSLQVRDARSTFTGQLFFEHQFDYFAPNAPKFLLIPVNLDQVSVPATTFATSTLPRSINKLLKIAPQPQPATYSKLTANNGAAEPPPPTVVYHPQQLIVSIRPVQDEGTSNFGRGSVELVSSAPVLVEPVPSSDGRRAFSIVQTDKPIYKPNEKVRIRAMVVNENLRPVIGDELRLQIKNPHKIVVESQMFPRVPNNQSDRTSPDNFEPMFIDHVFEFPPEPMLGKWSVHLLHSDQVANDTTSFEVKEYVLPPFELTLESPKYILPSTHQISGAAIAKYHFGKPVQGKIHFKFGIMLPNENPKTKFLARSSIKNIDPATGRVEYNISMEKISNYTWFPAVAESRLVVEATAMDMTDGHRETASDSSCIFMMMPYVISFEESMEDFKPGLTQHLVVKLIERLSLQPGPAGQKILAEFRDQDKTILGAHGDTSRGLFDTEATTDSSGRAVFKVGPVNDDVRTIEVTMKLVEPGLGENVNRTKLFESRGYTGDELAIGNHTLVRHDSQNGWIALMNKSVTHVNVGDMFVSDLLMKDFTLLPQKVFYTVVARGQIVFMDTIDKNGMINFKVTEYMMPSIRLVLFALTPDSIGLVSDSMRINVNQNLDCGLKLGYRSKDGRVVGETGSSVRPNSQGYLDITARQGDLISIIGVDNAVYSLNNRTRLESSRIVERIRLLDTGCGFGGGRNNLDVFHNAGLMLYKSVASETLGHIGSSCLSNPMKYVEEAAMGYPKPMLARLGQDLEAAPHFKVYAPRYLSRPKREVDVDKILNRYKDPIHRACCQLGTFEDIPQKRNCSTRKRIVEKYFRHSDPCASIYQDCCRHAFGETQLSLGNMFPVFTSEELIIEGRSGYNLQSAAPTPTRGGGRPDQEDVTRLGQLDKIEAETLIRRDFRETWLFDLVGVDSPSGKATLDVQMPHTITSWSVSALALNQYKPMCIMPRPFRINTFQEIFVQLAMPYKIVQGEQIDLVATLYNYSPQTQDVLVYMYGVEDLCSDAEPGERSEQRRVRVDKRASQVVIFSMIPLKIGQYPIKVVAVTLSSNSSDIVERQLNVVPRGKPVTEETTFSLDPMNQQRRSKRAIQTGNLVDEIDSTRGLQHSTIHLRPTRDSESIVPETQECIISAIGDRLGHVVQTSLLDVENLIRLPQGCGEQVMIYLGPTLYTAKYLESIDKLTGDLRWRAIRYIQSGYKRILNYRHDNGAFSAFPNREPSVWLTAFVAKMLCQTERTSFIADEIHVDKTVINSALSWLISKQHKKLGTWIEMNPVYHREMLGGILRESALSAFVALTFNECAHHSMDIVDEVELPGSKASPQPAGESARVQTNGFEKLRVATEKAEEAILRDRHRAVKEKNPYVMALIAYALSFNRPEEAAAMMNDLMPLAEHFKTKNIKMWRGRYHIETNSYALQAIIELAPLVSPQPGSSLAPIAINWKPGADALSLANFLSSQRSYSGAFDSTQDTVVALEALSKFAQLQSSPNGNALVPQTGGSGAPNLLCNVTISNRTTRSLEFGRENAQILQTFKLDTFELDPVSGENLDIVTSGSGLGIMSVKLKYNVFQADDELCRFDIDSSIQEWKPPKLTVPSLSIPKEDLKLPSGEVSPGGGVSEPAPEEQDLFKSFDKSMLNELNLLDPNRSPNLGGRLPSDDEGEPARRAKRNPEPVLRLRRYAPGADIQSLARLAAPLTEAAAAAATTESWTSKVVSSLRAKLPDWIAPKANTTTASGQPQAPPVGPTTTSHTTARRSAQSTPPPLHASKTTVINGPNNAHMNTLSSQFESTSYNKTSNATTIFDMTENPAHRLVLLLQVCTHHMSASRDSEMAVIEVGVLSGFKPNEADLKEVINDPEQIAMKYELSTDRSLVVLYMKYIPSSVPYCFQFRLMRDSPVYNLQSGYIRVYEYYSPTHSCSNYYTPSRINNLLETRCEGQACQCASRSLCPASKKLLELGERHQVNATSARAQLTELICSKKYDLVSLVSLKSVQRIDEAKTYKLLVKIKSDLKGNLTKIIDMQRQQKAQLIDNVRKPRHEDATSAGNVNNTDTAEHETSLDYLNLSIDLSCVRDDPLLLHLAHPNQWKQGGKTMVLFARSDKLERRYFRTVPRAGGAGSLAGRGPRPKPNRFSDSKWQQEENLPPLYDAQNQQYSLALPLDKDTILHDMTYQAKAASRESINNLLIWADLKTRRENWECGPSSAIIGEQ